MNGPDAQMLRSASVWKLGVGSWELSRLSLREDRFVLHAAIPRANGHEKQVEAPLPVVPDVINALRPDGSQRTTKQNGKWLPSAAADEPNTFASISPTCIAVSASARRRNCWPIRPVNISAVNDSSISWLSWGRSW